MKYPIIIAALCLLVACKKEKQGQFSTWYVNSDSFSTNEVTMNIDRGGNSLSSADKENGFELYDGGTGFTHPPDLGTHILSADYESGDPSLLHAYFYYHSTLYMLLPGQADTLFIKQPAGKYRYTLRPGWFVNTTDTTDSVQIHGIFNEP